RSRPAPGSVARGAGGAVRAGPAGRDGRPRDHRAPRARDVVAVSGALAPLFAAFPGQSLLVVGEAMLDAYLHGSSGRLCREAPVPIVAVDGRTDVPGGAANAAVNVRAL